MKKYEVDNPIKSRFLCWKGELVLVRYDFTLEFRVDFYVCLVFQSPRKTSDGSNSPSINALKSFLRRGKFRLFVDFGACSFELKQ